MSIASVDSLLARMRLRQLALVAAIEQCGSLNMAAQRVFITQPAATKMLHEIEEQLGGALFVREARGMSPTPLGNAAALFARQVVGDLGRFRDEVSGLQSGAIGSVVVGCTTAAISSVLSPAICAMQRDCPQATVKVLVDSSDMLLPQLLAGSIDILLGRVYSANQTWFHFEPISGDALSIVMGPGRTRKRLADPLAMLARSSWILPPVGNVLRSNVDAAFRESGRAPPRVAVETSSTLVTLSLLASTRMVSVLPSTID
ncbi:MAG: LysR family transcriptional regulator, partial [Betaproteobacteria bacterium]